MNQDFPENEVLIETQDGVGVITLNRPQVLNALSLEMIREIASTLHRWIKDGAIKAVVFKGKGGRAFCAGGDIRSFYNAGMDSRRGVVNPRVPVVFFAEEYSLNKQIFDYPKPTVAIMNGVTMGGGYGIAGHCNVRISTPDTLFAMPEARIGFFPDVGSLYHLHKCPKNYGRYLALTGQRLDGPQMTAAGLADFYSDATMDDITEAVAASLGAGLKDNLVDRFAKDVPALTDGAEVEAAFSDFDVRAILDRLDQGQGEIADLMRSVSPTSVMVTAAYLERSQSMSFDEIIALDFVLVQNFIRQADMYEGIRAQIIDKDRNPKWLPDHFEEITQDHVNTYFTPTGYDLKDVQIF